MPHSRFFIDLPFTLEADVLLEGNEAHHLSKVMRKSEGDQVELVNGLNQLAKANILQQNKSNVLLHIYELTLSSPLLIPNILCQALPSMNKLEIVVEKGTELGMTALWLFPGVRSEKNTLSHNQLTRLIAISISAMKQCGRLDLPEIVMKEPLSSWKTLQYPAYFGDVAPTAPHFLSVFQQKKGSLFFIGPEAGFAESEIKHLHFLSAQGVNLHPHILRTETASLVALSLISQMTNRFLII